MIRSKRKDGYIGGRVSQALQDRVNDWSREHKIPTSRIMAFAVAQFMENTRLQAKLIDLEKQRHVDY